MKRNKLTKDSSLKPDGNKPKEKSKMTSGKRKTAYGKIPEKDEDKKADIYSAMKDAGFGTSKPKIVTNNVRSYRF